jgi:alkaline phosphatase
MRILTICCLAAACSVPASVPDAVAAPRIRHVIVMIADGAGHNTLAATRFWKGAPLAVDSGPWRRASMAAYALRDGPDPKPGLGALDQDPTLVYSSAKAWDTTPVAGKSELKPTYDALYAGYEWNRRTAPDSANTMSAMMTGVRTYDGAINVDGGKAEVTSAAEAAKRAGKMTGAISSVPFNHATPASGGGAHNPSREDYHDLALDMFNGGVLDVIGGGGNPDFDHDGQPVTDEGAKGRFRYLPPDLWAKLKSPGSGWQLVQSRSAIEALARGDRRASKPLAMLFEAAETLQFRRKPGAGEDPATYAPGGTPPIANVPMLADMARAALGHVGGDADGFFLQIEGGAVDWAMHTNQFGRMIEEYLAFDDAVRAVIQWVDSPASAATWDDTLLIVTADHDHLLYGPDTAQPFQRVTNNGAGRLPGFSWASNAHSNQLVPLFARGAGADELIAEADEIDIHTDRKGRTFGFGRYLTQSEMGAFLVKAVE